MLKKHFKRRIKLKQLLVSLKYALKLNNQIVVILKWDQNFNRHMNEF
jgi:hypothetical protein